MNDPRTNPVPGAEIEVIHKRGNTSRIVRRIYGTTVRYWDVNTQEIESCPINVWRKWAFNGRIVAGGEK